MPLFPLPDYYMAVKTSDCDSTIINEKEDRLRTLMREMGRVLVAYSGGVDSSLVAFLATDVLGRDALSVMGISPSVSESERLGAAKLAEEFKLNFLTVETKELDDLNYAANPTNRCYFCKAALYGKLLPLADENHIGFVIDGSTVDDLGDNRPGREAANEQNVRSPLIEAGLSKAEVRVISKKYSLPTWDKPSSPCLSSRIAYGIPVTIERLSKVERGEALLRSRGFREFRVRFHGDTVRLEISRDEMDLVLNTQMIDFLAESFRAIGFKYVTLDLHGFRSGALNETLSPAGS
jgi:pyridinium-3,5-biscarboxylic acid mononucleotide sulfurtransferase